MWRNLCPVAFYWWIWWIFLCKNLEYESDRVYIPEKNFTLYGMAGVMAAVMHAPLTGIFLIAELTGGYNLFIPLIIVTISSYLTINIFEHHSIYAVRLARQGKLLTHNTDKSVLTMMSVDSIIDKDYTSVDPNMEMGKLIHAISASRNSYLPVVNDNGRCWGSRYYQNKTYNI